MRTAKKKRNNRPWMRASPLTSGVKDRPLLEKGEIGLLAAALNVWSAKNEIFHEGSWRQKKK